MSKLQTAVLAGARAIENNKRLQGAIYCRDVFGDNEEVSYYEAAQLLRELGHSDFVVSCCELCAHKVRGENGEYNPEDIVCDYWQSDGLVATDFCSRFDKEADT